MTCDKNCKYNENFNFFYLQVSVALQFSVNGFVRCTLSDRSGKCAALVC